MICLADAMAHLKGETFLEEACHCRQALGVKGLLHFQLATKDMLAQLHALVDCGRVFPSTMDSAYK